LGGVDFKMPNNAADQDHHTTAKRTLWASIVFCGLVAFEFLYGQPVRNLFPWRLRTKFGLDPRIKREHLDDPVFPS